MNPQSVSVREIWADEGRELAAATVESKESLLASQSKLSAEVAALKEELFALKGLQVEIGDLISSIYRAEAQDEEHQQVLSAIVFTSQATLPVCAQTGQHRRISNQHQRETDSAQQYQVLQFRYFSRPKPHSINCLNIC